MVVGESGLGKSTLINSLFLTDLYPERYIPGAAEKIERTVQIEASTVEIEERGVKLRLTVVDTPGYGDAINSQDCPRGVNRQPLSHAECEGAGEQRATLSSLSAAALPASCPRSSELQGS
ncbi:UNVERIFIED_CONTAM: hypothetical protein FKN15_071506 [Acipenser sinensis]